MLLESKTRYGQVPKVAVRVAVRTGTIDEGRICSADVTTAVTGPSLNEIFKEIARLRSEPPSEVELQGIKTQFSILIGWELRIGQMIFLLLIPDLLFTDFHDADGIHHAIGWRYRQPPVGHQFP
jgi:hypothetical protein